LTFAIFAAKKEHNIAGHRCLCRCRRCGSVCGKINRRTQWYAYHQKYVAKKCWLCSFPDVVIPGAFFCQASASVAIMDGPWRLKPLWPACHVLVKPKTTLTSRNVACRIVFFSCPMFDYLPPCPPSVNIWTYVKYVKSCSQVESIPPAPQSFTVTLARRSW
jgi:hypothetical protein